MVLFIDTDPGTDDIMAIIYMLKHSDHQLVGMSSVAGNLGIEVTTRNLRLITGYFQKECQLQIEVYKGASKSLVEVLESDARIFHGTDGCGDFFSSEYYKSYKAEIEQLIDDVKVSPQPAVMGLIEMSKKYCGQLTIMALGPLTNVALAQIIDPEFGSRIKELVIMGGDIIGHGNSEFQPSAEFNFNKDPEAAYVVFKEMNCIKTVLPLEPSFPININEEIGHRWIRKLETRHDLLANMMSSIIRFRISLKKPFKFYDLMLAILIVHPTVVSEMMTVNASVELNGKYTRGKIVYDTFNKYEKHTLGAFRSINVVKTLDAKSIFEKLESFFV